jgi:RNA polymerase sigma-70 factor (ECF subfamily)
VDLTEPAGADALAEHVPAAGARRFGVAEQARAHALDDRALVLVLDHRHPSNASITLVVNRAADAEASDAELLECWRAGDRRAGERLFDRHVSSVVRFLRNKVGDEFEDLVQQTFLACVASRDRLREDASFRVFLLSIARHKLYDHLDRLHGPAQRIDGLTTTLGALDPSPSAIVVKREEDRRLLWAMRQIPVELQIVLELHYWEGLGTAELGLVLGIPRGTVKTRLMRARALLRERLDLAPTDDDDDDALRDWAQSLREAVDDVVGERRESP